eukprot:6940272-Lingulodinium_polyedra.AAC.1
MPTVARVVPAHRPAADPVQSTATGASAPTGADAGQQAQHDNGRPTVARVDPAHRTAASQGEEGSGKGLTGGDGATAPVRMTETP